MWRVGLLVPSANAVMEVDFYRSLQHDTTLHAARMLNPETTAEDDERMLDVFAPQAADALRTVQPHVVVLGTTVAAELRGTADDERLRAEIERATGAPAISAASAVVETLRSARARRITVVTPYGAARNLRVKGALESAGFEIASMHGMDVRQADMASLTAEEVHTFVQTQADPRAPGEALLLYGTDSPAMSTLSLLKLTYDVPIVTSNQASLQVVKRILDGLREGALPQTGTRGSAVRAS
jgi:maleate cis-trans isomerase